jgi:hypothetical protein
MLSLNLLRPAGRARGRHRPAQRFVFKIRDHVILDGLVRP